MSLPTGRIIIEMDDEELETRFRELAAARLGVVHGSVAFAGIEALKLWIEFTEIALLEQDDYDRIHGTIPPPSLKHVRSKTMKPDHKERIRERDGRCCVLCGKTEKKNGQRLSVYHLNGKKSDDRDINLVSLCKACMYRANNNTLINHWNGMELADKMATLIACAKEGQDDADT